MFLSFKNKVFTYIEQAFGQTNRIHPDTLAHFSSHVLGQIRGSFNIFSKLSISGIKKKSAQWQLYFMLNFNIHSNKDESLMCKVVKNLTNRIQKLNWLIGLVGRVFTNGPGDLGSIPGCVIPKTLKIVLDTTLLNTQQYKVHIKGKVEQSRERSSTFSTPRCSSYWKGSLLVALDNGRQLYLLTYTCILNKLDSLGGSQSTLTW